MQYNSGALPEATPLGRRASASTGTSTGKQQHAGPRRHRRLHRQAGLRLDFEPDRQHRRADRVRRRPRTRRAVPVQPESRLLQAGAVTGAPAASVRPRPSPTRTSSSRRPGAPTSASTSGCRGASSAPPSSSTTSDVNGRSTINANLPAAQSTFTGADNRPRWTGTSCGSAATASARASRASTTRPATRSRTPSCSRTRTRTGRGTSPAALTKNLTRGFSVQGRLTTTASRRHWSIPAPSPPARSPATPIVGDPNNPALAYSAQLAGAPHLPRRPATRSSTSASARRPSRRSGTARTNGNTSYVFAGDMNGDTRDRQRPDLHPARSVGDELRAVHRRGQRPHVHRRRAGGGVRAATSARTTYLSEHRGEYAERNAVFLPMVKRMDLSLSPGRLRQRSAAARHAGQIRLDITNFGNLLNSDWGVGQRIRAEPDPDQRGRRRRRQADLPHGAAERRPVHARRTRPTPASPTST